MRFAIFTHVSHNKKGGEYYAYSPYVREMNLWLRNVKEVEVVAPLSPKGENRSEGLPYRHPNLTFTTIPSVDLLNKISSFKAFFKIPSIFYRVLGAMRRADHLHLRCPGNIGLLACICQIFFPHKPKTAKYAGNWDRRAKQPWSYNLQKWILSNTFLTRNIEVLVYGDWPHQTKNLLPFYTASFNESEKGMVIKQFAQPYKFLFVGSIVAGKQPLLSLKLIEALQERNIHAEFHVYGEGPLLTELEKEAENKEYIHLYGNHPLDVLKQAYKEAHFLILASKSEGWPKAVAEGMFFGCIPIATAVSCVPWMLDYGNRGILIPEIEKREETREQRQCSKREIGERKVENNDVLEGTVERIKGLLRNPEEMRRMSLAAQEWSQQYTLEMFEEEIKKLLKTNRGSEKKKK